MRAPWKSSQPGSVAFKSNTQHLSVIAAQAHFYLRPRKSQGSKL